MKKDKAKLNKLLVKLRELLKEQKLKNTAQRELILQAMFENNGHLTPDEVLVASNKLSGNNKIGKATIYRTLNFFEKEGFITSISFGIDGKKYELNLHKHHDHMICDRCGAIDEFFSEEIETIQENIAKNSGFELRYHATQLFGVCKKCIKIKKDSK